MPSNGQSGLTAGSAGNFGVAAGLKVLVADDHHLVREGLKLALKEIDDGVTVLEADTLESAIETFLAWPDIDLVLLDLSMPGTKHLSALDGFEASCPAARVVVVSATYDMKTVQAAVNKGVLGFIPKLAGKNTFIHALRFVLDGGTYLPPEAFIGEPSALEVVAAEPGPVPKQPGDGLGPRGVGLTARQMDVMKQLLEGKSNKQICRDLNLAMGTVKSHVAAILSALNVNSRAEAIAAADKAGWREWLKRDSAP